ncbi:MAG: hypothetical protein Q4F84_01895 [Fibrobacter sp.]|nr:hypothetical protein [Fibrobacter sp.]
MPNFYLIIISISIVFGITIIMSIIDWFYLHSLSLKITFLELEVEKKTREYDRIRKNIRKNSQNEPQKPTTEFTSEISTDHIQTSNDQGIEVVRNVRKPFDPQNDTQQTYIQPPITPQQSTLPEQNNDTYQTGSSVPDIHVSHKEPEYSPDIITETNAAPEYSDTPNAPDITNDTFVSGNTANDNVNTENNYYATVSENYSDSLNPENDNINPEIGIQPKTEGNVNDDMDVMDVINEASESELQSDSITLPLFSASNNDADFENLWHNLSDLLHSKQDAHIFIDFSNIQFLYDKELDYLEKICHAAQVQGSSIKFANCDKELTGLLCKRPVLLSHLT